MCVCRGIGKLVHNAKRPFTRLRKASASGEDAFAGNAATLGFQALQAEGLVNEDEWSQILANEAYGMPRYLTVMYWVEVCPSFMLAAPDDEQHTHV